MLTAGRTGRKSFLNYIHNECGNRIAAQRSAGKSGAMGVG
jgi:hypothetical protein